MVIELKAVANRNIAASGCSLGAQSGGKSNGTPSDSKKQEPAPAPPSPAPVPPPSPSFDQISALAALAPVTVFAAVHW
jgi:hypothetical protein